MAQQPRQNKAPLLLLVLPLMIVMGCDLLVRLPVDLSTPADARPPLAPTPLPTPEPLFAPGTLAEVQTIDGEVLYLRDAPSTSGAIVRYLYDAMLLTLLDGPVTADGYTWYRVRTQSGETGWAAVAVDDLSTLLPYTPAATAEPSSP